MLAPGRRERDGHKLDLMLVLVPVVMPPDSFAPSLSPCVSQPLYARIAGGGVGPGTGTASAIAQRHPLVRCRGVLCD